MDEEQACWRSRPASAILVVCRGRACSARRRPRLAFRRIIPVWVIQHVARFGTIAAMTTDILSSFSTQLADAVDAAAPAVVQVQGRRPPASGLVYADDVVLTTVGALGRSGDGLHVRRGDGTVLDAELAGWDPTTNLAVLKVSGLGS